MVDSTTISQGFPSWLTATKVLPLKHRTSLIKRSELIRRLNSGLDQKLSLLVASAGFGKSTVLGHWYKELRQKNIPVAWLNIDQDDNDPSLFAVYLAYSLAEAGLAKHIFKLNPAGFSPESSFKPMLGILLSAIAEQKEKVVLILDEVEKLDDIVVEKLLDPLFRYSPDNLHIVISTRSADSLHISTLKLQGQVNQITTPELKFTAFEIEEFFDNTLDKKNLLKVSEKTNGWPVALQLVKNSLSGYSDHKKIIEKFKGTEQDTRDYIFEQIVNNLPNSQKDLLLDVSILEQFDPATADRIRDAENSHIILKDMEWLNGLINPLDNIENHYRLHPLFREALVYYLEQSDPERMKDLHLKAASLFLDQGHLIQSIRHALQANEPETAADILEKFGGILLWNKEGMSRIRKAHALLPDSIINTRPRINLLRALVLLKDGSLNDARSICDKIKRDLENSDEPISAELDYDLAVIASTLAVYEGTPLTQEMSDNLQKSLERFAKVDKTQIGFIYTILCVFHLQNGNFLAANQVGHKAVNHFQKYHSIFGETYIYVHLGVVAIAEGKLDRAFEYYKKAQDNLRRYFIDDKDLKLVLNILMAEWHYEKNELNTAARLLGDVNHRLETGEAWYEIYATGYSTSSSLIYLQKGLSSSLNSSDDAISYIKREGLKRVNRLVVANKVAHLCRAGKIAKARKTVQANNLTFEDYKKGNNAYFSVRECYGVVQSLARLLIAEERYEEAITELEIQIDEHQPEYQARAVQKYHLLLAIAEYESGKEKVALQRLEKTLTFVRVHGFLRFVLDEEPFILSALEAYSQKSNAKEKDHAQYLLEQLYDGTKPQTNIVLSRREHQVLNQLTEGYSDKIIARNLNVSENTVRFHLKNIFNKLEVNSRLMAVSEANKHKLL